MANQLHRDVLEYMAKEAELYVTPEVRAAADEDPEYEGHSHITKYVICRELRCGFKSVGVGGLTKHLANEHKKKRVVYLREHNMPAIMSGDALERARQKQRLRGEKNARLLAKAAETERLAQKQPDPRITLAVCLELQSQSRRAMRDQLFPDLVRKKARDQIKARYGRTKDLFRRHPSEFAAERQRLAALPESDRRSIAESARAQISQLAPFSKVA
jgi:hypothetical protein